MLLFSRPILESKDHGYDSFIDGNTLNPSDPSAIINYIKCKDSKNAKHPSLLANRRLMYTLKCMGFEDTHGENFLVDKEHKLYFIDAEVYGTKIAQNIDDIIEHKEFYLDEHDKLKIKNSASLYKEKLEKVPTRLLLVSTRYYNEPRNIPMYRKIRKDLCKYDIQLPCIDGKKENVKDTNLKNFHVVRLAELLWNQDYINIDEADTFTSLSNKVEHAFDTDAIEKIHAEITEALSIREDRKEIPIFHFHLKEGWIDCPLTKNRLSINEIKEMNKNNKNEV